ncbi:MAG TPA: class I SAM-dependent methyltransferase [Planctomycetota bacterium]|nr:class I SAM-dependent methyltransferase [Planctomycetota bacterium]
MLTRILEPEVMDTVEDAREYDEMDFVEVNTLFAKEAARLATRSFGAGRMLDLGAGTARIPILIGQRLKKARIVAVDLSKEMLKLGRVNVKRARLQNRIRLVCCDAKKLPYSDAAFEMVVSNSIVHHIPHPLAVFREIVRVAKPGAGLFIKDLLRPASLPEWRRLVQRYAGGCNDYQRKLFADSLRAALSLKEVARLVEQVGLRGAAIHQVSDRHWTLEKKYDV